MPAAQALRYQLPAMMDAWMPVTVPRIGKTSLSFWGHRLFHVSRKCDAETLIWITLWKKQDGGYVISWSALGAIKIHSKAASLLSLSDVMDHLEDVCATLSAEMNAPQSDWKSAQASPLDFISDLLRRANYHRTFLSIASIALERWDSWIPDESGKNS